MQEDRLRELINIWQQNGSRFKEMGGIAEMGIGNTYLKCAKELEHHLTSSSSRAAGVCGCNSDARNECAFWDGEGGCVHPPPA